MKMLNTVGIGGRAGSGVPDILAVWEAEGWKKPEVQEPYDQNSSKPWEAITTAAT